MLEHANDHWNNQVVHRLTKLVATESGNSIAIIVNDAVSNAAKNDQIH